MRVLDLFCGAGGAAMGLHRAWPDAEIVGVDIAPQPRYPFTFVQADAMIYPLDGFDFVWASPPCQRHSAMTKRWGRSSEHPDLIADIRSRLLPLPGGWVIENVPGAPLYSPVTLCGSMFNLKVRRHRIFEANFHLPPPACRHSLQPAIVAVYAHAGGSSKRDGLSFSGTASWRDAMDIDWMTGNELAQSVPPAYSEYIARQFPRDTLPACIPKPA